MRLFRRAVIPMLAVAMALPPGLAAQAENPLLIPIDNTTFGGSSAEFLQFGSSARGMALGGAFSTIVDDVNSLHYNPAGLALMENAEASVTVMPYVADTDYYWTGLAFPFGGGDYGFGVFLGRFGFSDSPVFTEDDPEGLLGNTFGVDEVVAGLSFAHSFIDRFAAGVTLKLINDNLATGSPGGAVARTVAVDFGTTFHTEFAGRPIRLAFVVQNLGGDLQHSGDALSFRDFDTRPAPVDQRVDPPLNEIRATAFPLPRLFRVGLGYDPVSTETTRWTLMSEFIESNNQAATFGVATEFAWESEESPIGAALRGSWQLQPDERNLGAGSLKADTNLDGLNFGGGLTYKFADRFKAQFDYAFRHLGALGTIDVFTFTFGWK